MGKPMVTYSIDAIRRGTELLWKGRRWIVQAVVNGGYRLEAKGLPLFWVNRDRTLELLSLGLMQIQPPSNQ